MLRTVVGEIMTTQRDAKAAVRLALAALGRTADPARETLARAMGVGPGESAAALIARTPVRARPTDDGASLMRQLGLGAAPGMPLVDVSLRLLPDADATEVGLWLARFCPVADPTLLCGPSGYVLPGLEPGEVETVATLLARCPGLGVTQALQEGALFDVFAPEGFVTTPDLVRYLAILGFGAATPATSLGHALAVGLDLAAMRRLMARFETLGLIAVNHAFQRFDLMVSGPGRLSLAEAQDFLATRGVWARIDAGGTVRAERHLTRAQGVSFLADYWQIGLEAELVLARA